jgi:hypothetical protein
MTATCSSRRVASVGLESGSLDHHGQQMGFGGAIEIYWDAQKKHASYISSVGPESQVLRLGRAGPSAVPEPRPLR